MHRQEIIAVVLVILSSIGTVLAVLGYNALQKQPSRVELIARAPEKGNWSPQTIRVEKDREITLVIKNADVVTHGFYLPEFDLKLSEIKAGEIKELTFTPARKGEYTFFCSVWCSNYHMSMRGKLVVE